MTVLVRVPEASVDEHYRIVVRKNKIRLSRIAFVADPVAEPGFEQGRANLLFRLRVLGADLRHVPVSVFWGECVHAFNYRHFLRLLLRVALILLQKNTKIAPILLHKIKEIALILLQMFLAGMIGEYVKLVG